MKPPASDPGTGDVSEGTKIMLARIEALNAEVERLRAALERYRHCRHGNVPCFCYAEARAALEAK